MLKKKKIIKPRWLSILLRIIAVIVLIFAVLIIFIQSKWGQDIIVSRVVSFVEQKIGTPVSIEKLYLNFSGDVSLEGLYLEDRQGDSLIYSKDLQLSVALMPLIQGSKIHIKNIRWDGLIANVERDSDGVFNFDYIVDAFANQDTTAVDSTASPVFLLDAVDLSNFKLKYDDLQQGMSADFDLGYLLLEMEVFDLDQMDFEIASLDFANSRLEYRQTKTTTSDTQADSQEQESTLPIVAIQELHLQSLQLDFELPLEKRSLGMELGTFEIKDADFDISKSKIALNSLALQDTQISYSDLSADMVVEDTITVANDTAFLWPNYQVDVEEISLVNNKIYYQRGSVAAHQNFNASDLQIDGLSLLANEIHYAPRDLRLNIDTFRFCDADRFCLNNMAFDLRVGEESAKLSGFEFATPHSTIAGGIALKYPSIDHLMKKPESAFVNLNLPYSLDLNDLGYFQAELLENPYVSTLSTDKLRGHITSKGNLDSLAIESFLLQWQNTQLRLKGVATSVLDTVNLNISIPDLDIQSNNNDIYRFMSQEELGLVLPDSLQLSGSLSGGLKGGIADLHLNSTEGELSLAGNFLYDKQIQYALDLSTEELNVGRVIGDPKLAPITLSIKSMGVGSSLNKLNASLTSSFDSLSYAGYDLSPLKLNGQITDGVGGLNLVFKDENLDLNTELGMQLDSVSSVVDLNMDLNGANLYELGLTKKDIRTAFNLDAEFKGSLEDFSLESHLDNGVVVAQSNSYDIGALDLKAKVSKDQTNLKINHHLLNGELKSNVNPQQLTAAIGNYFKRYREDSIAVDSTLVDANALVDLKLKLKNGPLLNQVLLPGIQAMDSLTLALDFDQNQQRLSANLNLPYLNYRDNEIDSLQLDINGEAELMDLNIQWKSIHGGPVAMGKTYLKAGYENQTVDFRFQSMDSLAPIVDVRSQMSFKNDSIAFTLLPDGLILNSQPWKILKSNQIVYATDYIDVRDFDLNNGSQHIAIERKESPSEVVSLRVLFSDFNLGTIMNLLNPGQSLLSGVLDGDLEVDHIFGETGIQADLNISDFEALQLPLGRLSMQAIASKENRYALDIGLQGGYINMDLSGDYLAMENDGILDLSLNVEEFQMEALEKLAGESFTHAEGYLSAIAKITGNLSNPNYQGELQFHELALTPTSLNTEFNLQNQQITLDNEGLYINDLEITDSQSNAFTLDGVINTQDLTKPSFDLSVKADEFDVLNSSVEDNEMYYGKVSISTDLSIQGDIEIPIVRGNLSINEGSVFTMVVPESELEINQREGIVEFVNKSNTNDILTQNQPETQAVNFMEDFDLDLSLNVDKNSTFKIIMDKRTGDNLEVTGKGEFAFRMEPFGRMNLSGVYEVEDGHYQASLYNIVKRRFDIAPGSRLTWSGDPLEAQLDLQAIYKVETSASALMATQTAGVSEEVMRSYRQELPFLVYLNVDGELLSPELSFELDMPEESQAALGGNVYGYVQQLNSQKEELNKQVFSLLVLNRFFPSSGSDGSAGGPASIARDNVNNVLSDQLNSFSSKLMGDTGVDLNFGLDSYTDYQSATPQERTELDINASKSLFDDRLVIQVGSEVDIQGSSSSSNRNAPVIGNVALEYLITRDGRYRLRGYRKNQFESVVDGELIVTGISLIFSKEFNKFKELWERKIKEELDKELEKEKDSEPSKSKPGNLKKESLKENDSEESKKN